MTDDTERLSFQDDKGASRSTWIASALVVAIVAWMGSGYLLPSEDPNEPQASQTRVLPIAVAVEQSSTKPVTLYFQAEGQAQPDRDTSIRAEASGDVIEVLVRKGEDVAEGAVIARLSATSDKAGLTRAREERARAQREFDNASQLVKRGVATVDRVSEARATLAAAEASVAAAEQTLEALDITAPFAGRIETLSLDSGEFVQAGAEVGRIVDNHPLMVVIQVPQQALGRIRSGQTATVNFITGEEREGTVSFVGTAANAETRTFLTEITLPNEDGAIPAGISAEVRIPTGTAEAHFVRPSTVSLSPDGRLGIKTVDDDDTVAFHHIEIVRAEIDGVWVTGPPENARIITVGQGFVNEGETVTPSPRNPPTDDAVKASSAPPAGAQGAVDAEVAEVDVARGEPASDISATVTTTSPVAETGIAPESDAVDTGVDTEVGAASEVTADPAPSVPGGAAEPGEAVGPRTNDFVTSLPPGLGPDFADETSAARTVQIGLNALGYDAGPEDGVIGPSTTAAVRQFQRDRGLEVNDDISASLLAALRELLRGADAEPVTGGSDRR